MNLVAPRCLLRVRPYDATVCPRPRARRWVNAARPGDDRIGGVAACRDGSVGPLKAPSEVEYTPTTRLPFLGMSFDTGFAGVHY